MTSQEYPDAVGDVSILKAIDTLLARRDFSKTFNPIFGTVRPISELANKYVKSALLNAYEQVPMLTSEEMNGFLRELDPYFLKMSRICKNQLMHDMADQVIEMTPECHRAELVNRIAKAVEEGKQLDGEDSYISFESVPEDLQTETLTSSEEELPLMNGVESTETSSPGVKRTNQKEDVPLQDTPKPINIKSAREFIQELKDSQETDENKTWMKIDKYRRGFNKDPTTPEFRRADLIEHYADAMGYGGMSRRENGACEIKDRAELDDDPIARVYYAEYLKSTLTNDKDPKDQLETYAQITEMYQKASEHETEPNDCAKRKLAQMYLEGTASEDGRTYVSQEEGVKKAYDLFSSNVKDPLSQYYAGIMREYDDSLEGDASKFFENASKLGNEAAKSKLIGANEKTAQIYDMAKYFDATEKSISSRLQYYDELSKNHANSSNYSEGEGFNRGESALRKTRFKLFNEYITNNAIPTDSLDYYNALIAADVGPEIMAVIDNAGNKVSKSADQVLGELEQKLMRGGDKRTSEYVAKHALFRLLENIKPFQLESNGGITMGKSQGLNKSALAEIQKYCSPADLDVFKAVALWRAVYGSNFVTKCKILDSYDKDGDTWTVNGVPILSEFFKTLGIENQSYIPSARQIYDTLLRNVVRADEAGREPNPYATATLIEIACSGAHTKDLSKHSATKDDVVIALDDIIRLDSQVRYNVRKDLERLVKDIREEIGVYYEQAQLIYNSIHSPESLSKEEMDECNNLIDIYQIDVKSIKNEDEENIADLIIESDDDRDSKASFLDEIAKYNTPSNSITDLTQAIELIMDYELEEYCPEIMEVKHLMDPTDDGHHRYDDHAYDTASDALKEHVNRTKADSRDLRAGFSRYTDLYGRDEDYIEKIQEDMDYYGLTAEQLNDEADTRRRANAAARQAASLAHLSRSDFLMTPDGQMAQAHMTKLARMLRYHPEWGIHNFDNVFNSFKKFSTGDLQLNNVIVDLINDRAYGRAGTYSREKWINKANQLAECVFDSLLTGKDEQGEIVDLNDPMTYSRLHATPGLKKPFAAALGGWCAENGRYTGLAKAFYAQASQDMLELVTKGRVYGMIPSSNGKIVKNDRLNYLFHQLIGDHVTKGLLCMDDVGYGKAGEEMRTSLINAMKEATNTGDYNEVYTKTLKYGDHIAENLLAKSTAYDLTYSIFHEDGVAASMSKRITDYLEYKGDINEYEFENSIGALSSYIQFVEENQARKESGTYKGVFRPLIENGLPTIADLKEATKDLNIPDAVLNAFSSHSRSILANTFRRYESIVQSNDQSIRKIVDLLMYKFQLDESEITLDMSKMDQIFTQKGHLIFENNAIQSETLAHKEFKHLVNDLIDTVESRNISKKALDQSKDAWCKSLDYLFSGGNSVLSNAINTVRTSIAEAAMYKLHDYIEGYTSENYLDSTTGKETTRKVSGLTAYIQYATGHKGHLDKDTDLNTLIDAMAVLYTDGLYQPESKKFARDQEIKAYELSETTQKYVVKEKKGIINRFEEIINNKDYEPKINDYAKPTPMSTIEDCIKFLSTGKFTYAGMERSILTLDIPANVKDALSNLIMKNKDGTETLHLPEGWEILKDGSGNQSLCKTYHWESAEDEVHEYIRFNTSKKGSIFMIMDPQHPDHVLYEQTYYEGTNQLTETFNDKLFGEVRLNWSKPNGVWSLNNTNGAQAKNPGETAWYNLKHTADKGLESAQEAYDIANTGLASIRMSMDKAKQAYDIRPKDMANGMKNMLGEMIRIYRILDAIRGKSKQTSDWTKFIHVDTKTTGRKDTMAIANQATDLGPLATGNLWIALNNVLTLKKEAGKQVLKDILTNFEKTVRPLEDGEYVDDELAAPKTDLVQYLKSIENQKEEQEYLKFCELLNDFKNVKPEVEAAVTEDKYSQKPKHQRNTDYKANALRARALRHNKGGESKIVPNEHSGVQVKPREKKITQTTFE